MTNIWLIISIGIMYIFNIILRVKKYLILSKYNEYYNIIVKKKLLNKKELKDFACDLKFLKEFLLLYS